MVLGVKVSLELVLIVLPADKDEAGRVLSQAKRLVRGNYSSPPSFGGQIVAAILASPDLSTLWTRELGAMRERIRANRRALVERLAIRNPDLVTAILGALPAIGGDLALLLVERLAAHAPGVDFRFVLEQRGMFSYSGLTKDQVARLRSEFGVFAIDTGRICVAALNSRNTDYAAAAIASVIA